MTLVDSWQIWETTELKHKVSSAPWFSVAELPSERVPSGVDQEQVAFQDHDVQTFK